MTDEHVVSGGPRPQPELFTRPREGRVLLGVAAGLGRRTGLEAWAARVVFVALGLVLVGVPLYLGLTLLTRSDGAPAPPGPARNVGGAVIILMPFLGYLLFGGPRFPALVWALVTVAVGVTLVVGRGAPVQRPGAAAGVRSAVPRPPTLLLLSAAVALLGGALLWLVAYQLEDIHPLGAMLALGVVVAGAGQVLGAFRGRSFLLAPIGVALSLPLLAAAVVDVPLQLGTDDPGTITRLPAHRTLVLRPGADPVQITRAAYEEGLRDLVVRRAGGAIEVRVDRRVPLEVDVRTLGDATVLGGSTAGDSFVSWPRTSHRELAARPAEGDPLRLRVEGGWGEVVVMHTLPSQLDQADTPRRMEMTRDLAARRALLARERREVARLTARYHALVSSLALDVPVPPGVLTVPEEQWTQGIEALPPDLDPASARLARLRAARFDLMRAEWRAMNVQRGITRLRADLGALPVPEPPKEQP